MLFANTNGAFGGEASRTRLFKRSILRAKVNMMNSIVRVGDWIFVHAGITPENTKGAVIEELNNEIDKGVHDENNDSRLYKLMNGSNSFLVSNLLMMKKEYVIALNKTAAVLKYGKENGKIVVVGSTPRTNYGKCDDKLYFGDTMMSSILSKIYKIKTNKCFGNNK